MQNFACADKPHSWPDFEYLDQYKGLLQEISMAASAACMSISWSSNWLDQYAAEFLGSIYWNQYMTLTTYTQCSL